MKRYVLEGKVAVPCEDVMKWAEGFEASERRVAVDTIGEATVSTIFLGIDHSFGGDRPLLFETMVFGGPLDGEQKRCSTWEQAEAMHHTTCERVKAAEEG